MVNNINKILIIKIAAIGDLLLITPTVREIRKNFPKAEITLLVGSWSKKIIEDNPNIDRIIEIPDDVFFKIKLRSLIKLIFKLRQQHFDLVFVWHRSLAFRLFSWLLGIKKRIGFSRSGHGLFLTDFVPENPKIHEIMEYQTTLLPLGIKSSEISMDFSVKEKEEQAVLEIWQRKKLNHEKLIICLAPGGGRNPKEIVPLKHWPPQHYALLADQLIKEKGAKILWLGDKNDAVIVKNISSQMKNQSIDLTGQLDLKQLGAVIKKCQLFIGNDSAPMHLAAAVKTPVVALFGPTNPLELAPLNYRDKYLWADLDCSPCYKNGKISNCHSKQCLVAITPYQVYSTVLAVLKTSAQ